MSAKIAQALHEVMQKVGYVQKRGKNTFHGYRYAGEADLLEKLRPAMIEAGLLLIPSVHAVHPIDQHGNVMVEMEYTLVHKDGDVWPEKIRAAGCGNDRAKNGNVGDKGPYKAITGANKYLLFKLFQIETGDDPERDSEHESRANGNGNGRKSSAQAKRDGDWERLTGEIKNCNSTDELKEWASFREEEIEALPAAWREQVREEWRDRYHAVKREPAHQ